MTSTAQRLTMITAAAATIAIVAHIVAADPLGRLHADLAIGDMARYSPEYEWTCDKMRAKVCAMPLPDEDSE